MKKILVFLAVCFVFCMAGISAEAGTYIYKNKIPENAEDINWLVNLEKEAGSTYVIMIEKEIKVEETIVIPKGVSIILRRTESAGKLMQRTGHKEEAMFKVQSGGSLSIENEVSGSAFYIQGTNSTSGTPITRTVPLAYVYGTFEIKSGVIFNRCVLGSSSLSGTVFNVGSGGVLNMKGGTISGVSQTQGSGGAIAVLTGGKANLSGGVISGCTAKNNGGAVFVYLGGAVDISGTKIKSNSAGKSGGGIYNIGGSVSVGSCEISGNKAADGNGIYTVDGKREEVLYSSSFSLYAKPTISDEVCIKSFPAEIKKDFCAETAIPLVLGKNSLGTEVFECEEDASNYSDMFIVLGFTTEGAEVDKHVLSANGNKLCLNKMYTVKFLDYDGEILSTEYVLCGEDSTPPIPSEREGYKFVNWSGSTLNITSDITLSPVYEKLNTIFVYINGEKQEGKVSLPANSSHNIEVYAYSTENAELMLAEYKNGVFVRALKSEESSDDKYALSLEAGFDENTELKAMLWLSNGSLQPVAAARSISFEGISNE